MSALRKPGSNNPVPRFTHPQPPVCETVDEFLARGGEIQVLQQGETGAQAQKSGREKLRQSFPGIQRS